MSDIKLIALNEITGAVLVPALSNEDKQALNADSNSFFKAKLDVDVPIKVGLVENTDSDVNLTLPYYSELEAIHAEMIKDESMKNISGGEIIITLCVGLFGGGALALSIMAGASGGVGLACFLGGSIAGGLIGGSIAATSIAAGVQGSRGKNIDGSKK